MRIILFTGTWTQAMRTIALTALCIVTPLRMMGAPVADAYFAAGTDLTKALLDLQRRGLQVLFSTRVVTPDMVIRAEARSGNPRDLLRMILAPHGLDATENDGVLVIVRKAPAAVHRAASPLPSVPTLSAQIVVQPSRITLLTDEAAPAISLSREDIAALPHLADDVFRALRLLPGTTSSDFSAEINPRGGRRDEMLIRLDGQELYDPFHLKEYDNALSIVPASALERADLTTAAFPAVLGDRMGGVLDMTSARAQARRLRLVATIIGLQMEAGDLLDRGETDWFLSLRRGNTDFLGRAFHREGPAFSDAFARVEHPLTARQSLAGRLLLATDGLTVEEDGAKSLRTGYTSSHLWLTHRAFNGTNMLVDTIASRARLKRDRRGTEVDEERSFEVRDERELSVTSLTQSWNVQAGPHFARAGFDLRHSDAAYDYVSDRTFVTPLAAIRAAPREGVFARQLRLPNDQLSVYASDRLNPRPSITIDAGLRFDRHTSRGESTFSPRFSAAWALTPSTAMRAGAGRFVQSHRVHELMLEDGDEQLYPAERADQVVAGIEHFLAETDRRPLSSVRVEVYARRVVNPRPRYENLLAPFDPFPEGEFDRVRIAPERASAQGLELLLRGKRTTGTDWFLAYTLAATKDRIAGRYVHRSHDQRHALTIDVSRPLPRGWNLNTAWAYHSGRPTTAIAVVTEVGPNGQTAITPLLGAINGTRLPAYHRLDARLTRNWRVRTGNVTFFMDAHNVYSRGNVAGVDVKLDGDSDELTADAELWPRFFASAGVSWELNRR